MGSQLSFILGFFGLFLLHKLVPIMFQQSQTTQPKVHYYDFVLRDSNFTRLCSTKSMLTVNESFPGPTIRVRKGDTAIVNVHNYGRYGVTIHWHGVKQPRNPWYDGPENITQCAIRPGHNFTYVVFFTVEEGTLWWHAHSDWTRATVHGPIVILPALGTTYPFPQPYEEHTIVLGSWFKGDVMSIISEAMYTGGRPNSSDAHTINGQPGDLYPCSNQTTYRLKVKPGKTYLLRIVNAVMDVEIFFGIANHNLTVVGQDGSYLKPVTTDYISTTSGQTFDVLVTTNQDPSLYYMIASPLFDGQYTPFDNSTSTAILEYEGDYTPPSTPVFQFLPGCNDTDAAVSFSKRLRSLASKEYPIDVPKNITTTMLITTDMNHIPCPNKSCAAHGDRLASSLNNFSFVTRPIDILQAYTRNLSDIYTTDFPDAPYVIYDFTGGKGNASEYTTPGTRVKMLNYGEQVEMVFQGTTIVGPESHPMHLHGYSFYVVGLGYWNFDYGSDPVSFNLIDPPKVNTIMVPAKGWVAIRFVADNPGAWLMHCHLARHLIWGMSTVLIVKNGPSNDTSIRPRPSYMPSCSSS
ncbi:hypothetical protein Dsin_002191 [Dipteronia sinensis]|uniref:Laccase n=1 Tax=Dipteronia sinensis TaxID=43782 RepID=A0AAE0B6N2_9ROSI|nr:hypothetical protein Dsin_002191 [Dipteronia sinensis]